MGTRRFCSPPRRRRRARPQRPETPQASMAEGTALRSTACPAPTRDQCSFPARRRRPPLLPTVSKNGLPPPREWPLRALGDGRAKLPRAGQAPSAPRRSTAGRAAKVLARDAIIVTVADLLPADDELVTGLLAASQRLAASVGAIERRRQAEARPVSGKGKRMQGLRRRFGHSHAAQEHSRHSRKTHHMIKIARRISRSQPSAAPVATCLSPRRRRPAPVRPGRGRWQRRP